MFDFHPIQPQICRCFDVVSITINASNGDVVAFVVPSTLAFAVVFAVDFVAASINFKNASEYAEAILVAANVIAIVEAFAAAIAVGFSTSCVDDISLLGCFEWVRVWRCRSLSNSSFILRIFIADIFPVGKSKDIQKYTEVVEQGWLQIDAPYIMPDEEAETSYDYGPSQRSFELEDTAR